MPSASDFARPCGSSGPATAAVAQWSVTDVRYTSRCGHSVCSQRSSHAITRAAPPVVVVIRKWWSARRVVTPSSSPCRSRRASGRSGSGRRRACPTRSCTPSRGTSRQSSALDVDLAERRRVHDADAVAHGEALARHAACRFSPGLGKYHGRFHWPTFSNSAPSPRDRRAARSFVTGSKGSPRSRPAIAPNVTGV